MSTRHMKHNYLDARRPFADLKLSRGYLPIVSLQDDNTSQSTSPAFSTTGKGPCCAGLLAFNSHVTLALS